MPGHFSTGFWIYTIVGTIAVIVYGILRYKAGKKKYGARGSKPKTAQRRRR